jgi:hypothetical protein
MPVSTPIKPVWRYTTAAESIGVALLSTNNLSDVQSVAQARLNLGLGSAAEKDVSYFEVAGSSASVGALIAKNNLSDLTSVVSARNALGLGSAALQTDAYFLQAANNLSDLTSAVSARAALGLGAAALKAVSNSAQSTLASVLGTITSGHLAVFSDTSGTIKDGGAIPTGGGSTVAVSVKDSLRLLSGMQDGQIAQTQGANYADDGGGTTYIFRANDIFSQENGGTLIAGSVPAFLDGANGGNTAQANAMVVGGVITAVTPARYGQGYASVPNVVVLDPTGYGAVVTAVLSGGQITGYTVVNGGSGYSSSPFVVIPSSATLWNPNQVWYAGQVVVVSNHICDALNGTPGVPANTFLCLADVNPTSSAFSVVYRLTITNPGSGYVPQAVASISGPPGSGTTATATVNVSGGVVTSLSVVNPGSGYTSAPSVTISGGGGIYATATATMSAGSVTGFTVTNGGSGYGTPPVVTLTSGSGGGTGATAVATINAWGEIDSLTITNRGIGYTSPPTVTISGTHFTPAVATASVAYSFAASQVVTYLPVLSGGAGYSSAPSVAITGGGGTGAAATANISGGVVTSITITNPGAGYTSNPAVTLTGGGYTTAAKVGSLVNWANVYQYNGVKSISATYGGSGYTSAPTVTLTGGGGVGATAVATIAGGTVTGFTITYPGSGYTSAPTVTLTGGGYTNPASTFTVAMANPFLPGTWHLQDAGSLYRTQLQNTKINAMWFGATNDRSKDCTPSALDAFATLVFNGSSVSGALYYPTGLYDFRQKLVVNQGSLSGWGLNIVGDSTGASVLFSNLYSSDTALFDLKSDQQVNLRGLQFEGGGGSSSTDIVYVHDSAFVFMRNIHGHALSGSFIHINNISAGVDLSDLNSGSMDGTQLRLNCGGTVTAFNFNTTGATLGSGSRHPSCLQIDACDALKMSNGQFSGGGPYKRFSVTSIGSGGTVTTQWGHGFLAGDYVVLSGAANAGYNSVWKIASVPTSTTMTLLSPTGVALPSLGADTCILDSIWSCARIGALGYAGESSISNVIFNTAGAPSYGSAGVHLDGYSGTVGEFKISNFLCDFGNTGVLANGATTGQIGTDNVGGNISYPSASITGSTATTFTVNCGASCQLTPGRIVSISGATGSVSGYNGLWPIISVSGSTLVASSTLNLGPAGGIMAAEAVVFSSVANVTLTEGTVYPANSFGGYRIEGCINVMITTPSARGSGSSGWNALVVSDGGQFWPTTDVSVVGGALADNRQVQDSAPLGIVNGVVFQGTKVFNCSVIGTAISAATNPVVFGSSASGSASAVNGLSVLYGASNGQFYVVDKTGTFPIASGGGTAGVTQLVQGTGIVLSPSGGTGVVTISSTGGGGSVSSVSGSGSGISVSPTTGAVVVQNTGVTSLTAGANVTLSGSAGAVTISATPGAGGVSQIVAGANVTISPSGGTGTVTINATGAGGGAVSSVSASGAGIAASPTTGAVVLTNTGVTSLVQGTGIAVSSSTGNVTVANTGVTSIVQGTGITVSGSTGAVTISSTGGYTLPTATSTVLGGIKVGPSLNITSGVLTVGGVCNVRDYGAVGDGVVDDTASINLAASALTTQGFGTLYFPDGRYLISGQIQVGNGSTYSGGSANVPYNANFTVKGNGRNASVIIMNNTSGAPNILYSLLSGGGSQGQNYNRIEIRDLGFRNSPGKTCGAAISIDYGSVVAGSSEPPSGSLIENVDIGQDEFNQNGGFTDGVIVNNPWKLTILNVNGCGVNNAAVVPTSGAGSGHFIHIIGGINVICSQIYGCFFQYGIYIDPYSDGNGLQAFMSSDVVFVAVKEGIHLNGGNYASNVQLSNWLIDQGNPANVGLANVAYYLDGSVASPGNYGQCVLSGCYWTQRQEAVVSGGSSAGIFLHNMNSSVFQGCVAFDSGPTGAVYIYGTSNNNVFSGCIYGGATITCASGTAGNQFNNTGSSSFINGGASTNVARATLF